MGSFASLKTTTDWTMEKAKKVEKGKTLVEADISIEWMTLYGKIAQRSDQDRRYGLTRYSYEPIQRLPRL